MAYDTIIKTKRDGTMTLRDNAGTNSLVRSWRPVYHHPRPDRRLDARPWRLRCDAQPALWRRPAVHV